MSRSQWAWAKGGELVGAAVRGARWLGKHEVLRERLETERPARIAPSIPTLTWVATAVILIAALEPAVALGRSASRGGRAPVARAAQDGSLTLVAYTRPSPNPSHSSRLPAHGQAARVALLAFGSGFTVPHGSQAVRALQRRLATLGYAPGPIDGRYGRLTEDAVIRFQAAGHLRVDGIAGPQTMAALASANVVLAPGDGYVPGGSAPVRALQRHLAAAGFSPGPIDGRYGPRTERAVMRFQAARHLHVDGIAGRQTLGRLEGTRQRPVAQRPATHKAPGSHRPAAHKAPGSHRPATRTAPRSAHRPPTPQAHSRPVPTHQAAPHTKHAPSSSLLPWVIVLAGLILAILAALVWNGRRSRKGEVLADTTGPGANGEITPPVADHAEPDHAEPVPAEPDHPEPVPAESDHAEADHAEPVPAEPDHAEPDRAEPVPEFVRGDERNGPQDEHPGAGAFRLGQLLAEEGELAAAKGAFQRADQRGHPAGAFELGVLLAREGDWSGAEHAFRVSADRGDAGAGFALGVLLDERGDRAGAKLAFQRADQQGDPGAAYHLGQLLEQDGDLDGAKAAYTRADQRGHPSAGFNLGVLLFNLGDPVSAEEVFARADENGDPGAACNHGVLLEQRGDLAGAKLAYQRADERGDRGGAHNLAQLLEQEGDREGAKAAYARADQRGDPASAYSLGRMLSHEGDHAGAVQAFKRASDLGQPEVAELAHAALRELGVEENA